LIGFSMNGHQGGIDDVAIFDKKFDPQLGFVSFLEQAIELGTKFSIGSARVSS